MTRTQRIRCRGRLSRKFSLAVALFTFAGATGGLAQRPDFGSFSNAVRLPSGFRVDSLTWNMDYFSLHGPNELNSPGLPLGSALGVGAGARMGWYLRRSRTDFEVQYAGEYNGFTRYPQLRGLDQNVSIIFRRKLTPKLEWDVSANGQSTKISELLLAPSALIAEPKLINDSSGAISAGALRPDVGLSPAATAISALDSPFALAVSGARLYMSSVTTAFLYAATPKLAWYGHAEANRLWYRQDQANVNESISLLPPQKDIDATSGFAYLLGKKTEIGVDVNYDRSQSAYHEANAADLQVSLTRRIGSRWLIGGGAGPGVVILKNVGQANTRTDGYNTRGAIGYQGLAHAVTLSGDTSVSGRFSLGEDRVTSGKLLWKWNRRGSPWTWTGSLTYERLTGASIPPLQAWLASFSAARKLTPRTGIIAEFVNASDSAPTIGALNGVVRRAARIAFVWSPSAGIELRGPQQSAP